MSKYKTLKEKPYENNKMFSINDNFLAHVSNKRMNWYLDKNLATKIKYNEFKLNFKTKGDNENRGDYYQLSLKNNCVVCGTKHELTKHHVVPYQYRKYLSRKYKSKNSFDVLCLCYKCHREYEKFANELKDLLLIIYNLKNQNNELRKINKTLTVLDNYSDFVDEDKKLKMINFVEDYFNDSLDNILDDYPYEIENEGLLVIREVSNQEGFIIMWRKHFIDYAKPKYLPQEWIDEIYFINKAN